MSSLQDKINMLEFHNHLLLKMIDGKKFPFYALIIQKGITKKEMDDVFTLCEEVNQRFEMQQENGLVDDKPLLLHFVGMLNPKLPVKETIIALYEQNHYPALMAKLIDIMNKLE